MIKEREMIRYSHCKSDNISYLVWMHKTIFLYRIKIMYNI